MKKEQSPSRIKSSSIALLVIASALGMAFAFGPIVQKAHAYTVPNTITGLIANGNPDTELLNVANAGDTIVVIVQLHGNSGNSSVLPFSVASDTQGNSYTKNIAEGGTFQGLAGFCGNACGTGQVFITTASAGVNDHITVTPTVGAGPTINGAWEALDLVGVVPDIIGTTGGTIYTGPLSTALSAGSGNIATANVFGVGSFTTGCTNGHVVTPNTGFTWLQNGGSLWGGIEYGTPPTTPNPAIFTATCAITTTNWFAFGVRIGTIFTCSITNLDGPNYLLTNINKFYLFKCEIQSNAISVTPSPITDVQIIFNDSLNIYRFEYNNVTGLASIDSGGTIAELGTPTVSSGLNTLNQVRTMNITFPIKLGPNANQAIKRGIQLLGETAINGLLQTVQPNYFVIMNTGQGGGGIKGAITVHGLCAGLSGGDLFQTTCAYGANPHNWIYENATYYQLQQYQAQFSIQLDNHTNGLQEPALWQDFGHSGAGTNPSSNSKDWQLRAGMYQWDNTTKNICCWVKGVNVRLYMATGAVGSNNLWTGITAEWYYGTNLVSNQTFYAFVPSSGNGNSQVGIWLNFWYSQNNGSTTQGGEVGAYYTGMHQTGALIWTSWSPIFQNQTQLQTFVPLVDHSNNLIKAQQAQLTQVFMNMSRPGAPNVHAKQGNFDILTTNFQEQEFNVASEGMTGIVTPTFAIAVIPIVQSNSIFSPIINAIKSIGTFFGKTLLALGTAVWNGLGQRFPWFTGFFSQASAWILDVYNITTTILTDLLGLLTFIIHVVQNAFYPITIIINAFGKLGGFFTFIPANQLPSWIELFIIMIFGLDLIEALANNDWPHIFALVSTTYRVVEWVLQWTWLLVKLLIDSIEGLIP